MKTNRKTKNMRRAFFLKGRKCQKCGEVIDSGGHFVPALGIWTCPY